MYTDSQRGDKMIGVPGTPLLFTTTGVKGANTCFVGPRPMQVDVIGITITTAITVTSAVVAFKYRPTPGSATGEVTLGTLTLPVTGSTIGHHVFKKIPATEINPGGELVLDVTTAATAGAGFGLLASSETTEIAANVPAMITSA